MPRSRATARSTSGAPTRSSRSTATSGSSPRWSPAASPRGRLTRLRSTTASPSRSSTKTRRRYSRRSIALERRLDRCDIGGRQQHQGQKDAGLLRRQVLAGNDAGLAQPTARRDAAGGAAALHDDDARPRRREKGGLLRRARRPRREPRRDEALRPRRDRRLDEVAIGAGVGIDDVDTRQRRDLAL